MFSSFFRWIGIQIAKKILPPILVYFGGKVGIDKLKNKECPYCAETIKKKATICIHCKKEIEL
jgi:hypothetical protein